ncbi:MAG: SDR family NAD(P)-dependent oxidoreductase, partial [Candidatus Avigastranaerophilus sp.]
MKKSVKTILITGTSTGIGREIALKLAKEGHKVFAGVRRKIDKNELESLNPN